MVATGQQSPRTKPVVVFTVDGKPVTSDEFIWLYRKNNQNKAGEFTDKKVSDYVDLLVNFKLKVTEAVHRGLDTTAGFEREFATYRDDLKRPFVASHDDVNRLVKEAYERMQREISASHILINLKPDAAPADTLAAWNRIVAIRARAMAGEDFQQLAKAYSEDPSAKSNGGDLGYFTAFQMVYPFESAAFNTVPGSLSQIVRTRFGYHLIKVYSARPASGEVEVSHIMIRTGRGNDDQARNRAFEAYEQLKAGRSWEEVCKEYTEDPNTKDAGGRLRPFGHGAVGVASFEDAAFGLQQPGEWSDPFQTPFGWHIVRLERKIPLPTFEEAESGLRRRVSRDERLQISKSLRLAQQKRQAAFSENESSKSRVLQLADTMLLKAKWKYTGDPQLLGSTLFTLQGRTIPVSDFVRYVVRNQQPGSGTPVSQLTRLYDQFVEHALGAEEDLQLMAQNPEYRNVMNEYREGILLFEIMEKEIWNKASADSVGQRSYYEQHRAQYQAGDRIRSRIFSTADKAFFQSMIRKIQAGDSISAAEVRKFRSVISYRAYQKGESKVIDQVPWAIGVHQTERDGNYYIVQHEKLLPPGPMTFDEARAKIISDYQDSMEKTWLETLRKKYGVKVNTKGKKYVISQLTAK